MRTPNCECLVCGKPMYRRPYELTKVKHVACMKHRAIAQTMWGQTEAQIEALSLGRERGTNHRTGYKHRDESKKKTSLSHKKFHAENPKFAVERSKKTRGDKHYRWKGGVTKLNLSIRQMHENRKWMKAVKIRDGACVRCGSKWRLETHHKISLAELIERHSIKDRDDARNTPELWDTNNGETICEICHYKEHDRTFSMKIDANTFAKMPAHLQTLFNKLPNPSRDEVVNLFPQETARFFYSAKANEDDRPHGKGATTHPTIKPLDLMKYLVRLVCAKGGTVLDPFTGSGSTGCAAIEEGMWFVGIEQDEKYADIAIGRIKLALEKCPSAVRLETGEEVVTKKATPPPPKRLR